MNGAATSKVTRVEGDQSRLRAQGVRTRAVIVKAATKLLLDGGALEFTLRAVARQAKVSISNLQYYFPDRKELLRAVIEPVLEGYREELASAVRSDRPAREALDAIFDRALADTRDPRTMALTWHFASLSSVDPECARLWDEWNDTLVRGLAGLIEKINPEFGPAGSVQFAMLLTAMGDGLGFQVLHGKDRPRMRHIDASFRSMVNFLLQRNPLATGAKNKATTPR
jgi:AcrR family transcriptional regulator